MFKAITCVVQLPIPGPHFIKFSEKICLVACFSANIGTDYKYSQTDVLAYQSLDVSVNVLTPIATQCNCLAAHSLQESPEIM